MKDNFIPTFSSPVDVIPTFAIQGIAHTCNSRRSDNGNTYLSFYIGKLRFEIDDPNIPIPDSGRPVSVSVSEQARQKFQSTDLQLRRVALSYSYLDIK